ncbi:RICIN domain-containing protein [Micromonospora sp. NPDC023966]|uniref:RICIN domain-containing protein n=1 Tax=Micromonospora sp. NPDC023966 TaxID=3154699 RepID=UPI0033EDECE0
MASSTAAVLLTTLLVGTAPALSTPTAPPPSGARTAASAASPTAEAADAAGAVALARRTGRRVEITGERTETTQVFANPSGTRTMEQYVLPVRTRRDGRWVPVDTRLARNADGSVSPGATSTDLRLSGGGSGPLVTASRDDGQLSLSWPTALPAPILDGDTATYPAVLPGVDLRVAVDPVGFSEVLVVHDVTAARNPALRRIRFATATRGLTLRADPDGGSSAVDPQGRAVFTSGTPMMWDTPPAAGTPGGPATAPDNGATASRRSAAPDAGAAPDDGAAPGVPAREPRRWAMRTEMDRGELAVLPEPAALSDPDVHYPLYLDPSYSAAQYRWTLVDKASPSTSYWTDDFYRKDVRVGPVYGSSDGPWRSFFQMNVAPLARATISRAWFSITMTHTGSCSATSVELWHTKTIDPATAVTWNNSGVNWLDGKALDTQSGKANKTACGQPPLLMEFGLGNGSVKSVVQQAVDAAAPQEAVGFGLRIPSAHESDDNYWKRFDQATARLDVEYNTAPLAPTGVSTVPPTPCGTATAPTPLNTTTPALTGVGYDPNGDNVSNDLDILSGETVVTTINSGTVASGTAVPWPAVPPGALPGGQPDTVFSYRARTTDGGLAGPYSARCYFTVDTARPGTPTIASTDYPAGTAVRSVGETGTVTFTKGAADADVTGFQYGFSPESTTMWVAAGADGTATVPVTLWPSIAGDTSDVRRTLYARAIDRAGNSSGLTAGWSLVAHGRTVSTPPVPGDTNGDRHADLTAVIDQGYGRTTVWSVLTSPQGSLSTGYIGWDTDTNGGFPLDRIRSANGDFNGDGRADVAVFREDPDGYLRLFLLLSDGTRFTAASQPAWSGTGFHVSHLKVVAGDFNGDGYADLALLQGLAGNQGRLWVQLSAQGSFGNPVLAWDSGAGNLAFAQANLVAGDFNGDGNADLADVYDAGGSRTKVQLYTSAQGTFGAPAQVWDSGAGAFAAGRARFATGDVDGTAGDEIVALYDDGAATARLFTIGNRGGTWSSAAWWSSGTGAFDASRATLAVGDYTGDGRADVGTLYDLGGGVRRMYTFASSGTAFADKQTRWEGYVSNAQPGVYVDGGRKYRLQPVHSGKCVDVPGGSTANGTALDQYDCVATATWEQFRVTRVGASPYFRLGTDAGKCVDDKSWSLLDNAAAVQWTCDSDGLPQPNQQFRLDYVSGRDLDTVVTIRNVHSDKCLTVSGASTANNAAVVQTSCAATPPTNQQFFLRVDP